MRNKILFILLTVGILFILSGFSIYFQKTKITVPKNNSSSQFSKIINTTSSATLKPTISKIAFVSEVYDGDTIKTKNGEIIRYIGINSPEKTDPFYQEALTKNSSLVINKNISLELDATQKDRYGRTLAYVYVGSVFVNLEMVKAGLAVSETIQSNIKHQDEIVSAQKAAREKCLGIWQGLCQTISTCIKISNINYNATGDDNKNENGEWVEIQNTCGQNVSMDNWLLKDSSASNEYHFKNFSLSANATVDLYSGCGQDSQDKLYWSCPELQYAVWNNSGDHAYLYNNSGELVSDYQY
jgi:micrococcal nuclease